MDKSFIRHIDRSYTKGRLFLIWRKSGLKRYKRLIRLTENPIIIGGCGRSGTTLLLSLLSCHPNIYAIPHETMAFAPKVDVKKKDIDTSNDFFIDFIYDHLIENEIDKKSFDRWCEKTPANIHFFERIVKYFGKGVKFINMVRDGRNVVTSKHPTDPSKYWVTPQRWARDVSAGKMYDYHPQMLTVKYESLTDDPRNELEKICKFIDEPYSKNFEGYPETSNIKKNRAWFSNAKKVKNKTNERWRSEEHKSIIDKLYKTPNAEELLEHYGYLKEFP